MLTDPQIITVNAVAKSMARILSEGLKSTYQSADGLFKLTVSHQETNTRIRSMMRVDQKAIVVDPLTSANDFDTLTYYSVIDRPEFGFSSTQLVQLIAAHSVWLDSTMINKLYGRES